MSVQTTADDRLEDAANCVHAAVKALSDILIEGCWGADEFNHPATTEMRIAFSLLQKVHASSTFNLYRSRTSRAVKIVENAYDINEWE